MAADPLTTAVSDRICRHMNDAMGVRWPPMRATTAIAHGSPQPDWWLSLPGGWIWKWMGTPEDRL